MTDLYLFELSLFARDLLFKHERFMENPFDNRYRWSQEDTNVLKSIYDFFKTQVSPSLSDIYDISSSEFCHNFKQHLQTLISDYNKVAAPNIPPKDIMAAYEKHLASIDKNIKDLAKTTPDILKARSRMAEQLQQLAKMPQQTAQHLSDINLHQLSSAEFSSAVKTVAESINLAGKANAVVLDNVDVSIVVSEALPTLAKIEPTAMLAKNTISQVFAASEDSINFATIYATLNTETPSVPRLESHALINVSTKKRLVSELTEIDSKKQLLQAHDFLKSLYDRQRLVDLVVSKSIAISNKDAEILHSSRNIVNTIKTSDPFLATLSFTKKGLASNIPTSSYHTFMNQIALGYAQQLGFAPPLQIWQKAATLHIPYQQLLQNSNPPLPLQAQFVGLNKALGTNPTQQTIRQVFPTFKNLDFATLASLRNANRFDFLRPSTWIYPLKQINISSVLLPTSMSLAGGVIGGPVGLFAGTATGISLDSLLNSNSYFRSASFGNFVKGGINSGISFASNAIWSSITGFGKTLGLTSVILISTTALILFIINNSAFVVPIDKFTSLISGQWCTKDCKTGTEFFDCKDGGKRITAPGAITNLLPDDNPARASKLCTKPKAIIVHWSGGWTGNVGTYNTLMERGLACHFGTDESSVMQMQQLFENQIEWTACGNPKNGDLHIEMAGLCFSEMPGTCGGKNTPPPESETKLTIDLICWLKKQYNISSDYIIGHYEFNSGKPDPGASFLHNTLIPRIKRQCG